MRSLTHFTERRMPECQKKNWSAWRRTCFSAYSTILLHASSGAAGADGLRARTPDHAENSSHRSINANSVVDEMTSPPGTACAPSPRPIAQVGSSSASAAAPPTTPTA